MWDPKYFAIYRVNTREAFTTPFNMKDAMENTDVLYYAEGAQATVSSIRVRGGYQAFITNGRIEASSRKEDLQCQYTLGHLPMLLNRRPRKVFVLGTGSGMTLGATSAHPGVEEIVLAEIEPKVIGVARSFSKYNHSVIDHPKLRIVINDGRNYLLTTKEKFDVITADPIHPWFSGAGYLYTTEYFRLAAERLRPGGVVCQWLPIYELSVEDLKCVVRTFAENFKYTLLWLTRNDAELLGSNDPIVIDEKELERRIAVPGVLEDLKKVHMGSSDDFLSYFVMGTKGMKAFGAGGVLNTDDNLHLEFSAPLSLGIPLQGWNAQALYRFRESILPYLLPEKGESARAAQVKKWDRYFKAGEAYSVAHVLFLRGRDGSPDFRRAMEELSREIPDYAPFQFLKGEMAELVAMTPMLVRAEVFPFLDDRGEKVLVEISAVRVGVGEERSAVIFVDNRARTIFGQVYIDAPKEELDGRIHRFAADVMTALKKTHEKEAAVAASHGKAHPPLSMAMDLLNNVITRKIQGYSDNGNVDQIRNTHK
jgi:spermidine synthase